MARKGYPPGVIPRAYPPGTIARAQPLTLSPDYLRLLEQKAYSGQQFLPADQFQSVIGGGYSNQLPITSKAPAPQASPVDLTADQLNQHLGGVLNGKGQMIIDTAKKYGVDPRLVAGVIMTESVGGTSHMAQTKNNVMGLFDSRANTYRTFNSPDASVDFGVRNLAKNYLAQGLDTPEKIGAKYAPPGAANDPGKTNPTWPALVRANIARLGGKGGDIQQTAATGNGAAGGQGDTGMGPIYIAPVDRSMVKTPTGRNDMSTQDEMTAARARAEDYVQSQAAAGYPVNQKDYQEKFDAFLSEVHQRNNPPLEKQVVSSASYLQPEQPVTTTTSVPATPSPTGQPNTLTSTTTTAPPPLKMPTGRGDMTLDQQTALANSQTGHWIKGIEQTGGTVTREQATSFYNNALSTVQKLNIGIPPERLPAADGSRMAALAEGITRAKSINQLQHDFQDSSFGSKFMSSLSNILPEVTKGNLPGYVTQSDQAKAFEAERGRSVPIYVEGLSGSQRLSEPDIETTKAWMPQLYDTKAQSDTKTNQTIQDSLTMWGHLLDTARSQHYDVSDLQDQYDKAQADFNAQKAALQKQQTPAEAAQTQTQDVSQIQAQKNGVVQSIYQKAGYTPPPVPGQAQDKKISFGDAYTAPPSTTPDLTATPTPAVSASGAAGTPLTSGDAITGPAYNRPSTAAAPVVLPAADQTDQNKQINDPFYGGY